MAAAFCHSIHAGPGPVINRSVGIAVEGGLVEPENPVLVGLSVMSSEVGDFAQSEQRQLHVLLAEDHPTNRMVVELILGSSGVEVTSVEDGSKAVDRFKTEHFDAVIMDVQMPVMDGLTAIRAIRAHEAERGVERTPVHVLSTNALPQDFAASLEAGADSHLTKPVNASALLTTVLIGKVA